MSREDRLNEFNVTYFDFMCETFHGTTSILYEGLTQSYDKDGLIGRLNYLCDLSADDEGSIFEPFISKKGNVLVKIKNKPLNIKQIDQCDTTLKQFGYFISGYFDESHPGGTKYDKNVVEKLLKDGQLIYIKIEPIFDTLIENVPDYVYHLTPKSTYNEKIRKIGITPKSKNKMSFHPERIYLILKYDVNELSKFLMRMKLQLINSLKKRGEYVKDDDYKFVLLKINTSKVPNLKLRSDPNYKEWGAFTLNNIPTTAIEAVIEEEDIK